MHVAILGLGPSVNQYLEITKRAGGRHNFCDEVWCINALGGVFDCDLIFHMDDVRIQEIRAEALPESNIAAMLEWMKTSKTKIMTSRKHPDYKALIEFPLEKVINQFRFEYFNSTAAYAVAYAIYKKASEITIFGNDFTYPNSHDAEKGRACVEFWLGVAAAKGIKLTMPPATTLMDSIMPRQDRLYGYDTVDVTVKKDNNGKLKYSFGEKGELPTAEEIEDRYDHSKHPNVMVQQD